MKNNSLKTNKIPVAWKRILPAMQLAATLGLMGLSTAAVAQGKSSTPAKAAGAVLPAPTPKPAGGSAQKGATTALPAVRTTSTGNANPTGMAGDVSGMTTEQFRALASTATVRYKGQSLTKADFMAQRRKELRSQAKTVHAQANIKFKAAKAEFKSQQTLNLAARNAQVKAVAEGYDRRLKQLAMSSEYSALSKEAATIVQRYPSAPPADQAKLKQRAVEIHGRMQKMEQDAIASR